MSDQTLVLRSVYLPSDLDERLRLRAFNNRVSKNELIRDYLDAQLRAETNNEGTSSNKKVGSVTIRLRKGVRSAGGSASSAPYSKANKPSTTKRHFDAAAKKAATKKVAKKAVAKKVASKRASAKRV
jgi:hypothetical protein